MKKLVFKILIILIFYNNTYSLNTTDDIFEPLQILDVHISFDNENYLDSLYHSHETKEYITAHININGEFFDSVGVRFKGFSSFFGYPGDKKSFRIKFDKFKEQRFAGLNRINLNNGWSDPTMLREKLYLDYLKAHKIPAPRANFARVYLNENYWGLYVLTEHVDKTFLKSRFNNNDGNLFKAEKLANFAWKGNLQSAYYEHYMLQTNEKENNWNDLLGLINVINNTSATIFKQVLDQVLDTNGFIRAWAANNLFINMDSYLGSANNFYLYNDEVKNKFRWIIWDVNLAFGARTGKDTLNIFWHPERRPLIENILQNEEYRQYYLNTMNSIMTNFTQEYFYPQIDSLFDLIKEDYFADTLKMYSNEETVLNLEQNIGNIPGLKSYIKNRSANIKDQINFSTYLYDNIRVEEKFLFRNYPNPFNGQTTIQYSLAAAAKVKLMIFDMSGRKVVSLVDEQKPKGLYDVRFDATGLSSGIYFMRLFTKQNVLTRRIIYIK